MEMASMRAKELFGTALDWAVFCAVYDGLEPTIKVIPASTVVRKPLVKPLTFPGATLLTYSGAYDAEIIWQPSSDSEQGGRLILEHGISTLRCDDDWGEDEQGFCTNERIPVWGAVMGQHGVCTSTEHQSHEAMYQVYVSEMVYGPTPLTAAMRCLAQRKFGPDVSVPLALLQGH